MTEVKKNKFHCGERTHRMNALSSTSNFDITIYTFFPGSQVNADFSNKNGEPKNLSKAATFPTGVSSCKQLLHTNYTGEGRWEK